ncbi:50S ribosomal protein L21 [Roseovarius amoyensis]|uniref:50S ribosomal protein L21 n=1 Tax=Roseovarius amoyensis TaxID=2211448 RepID=UPI000DBE383B|nr:50S ribosomal protein L21 [Roseovarius amoyensis]
MFAVLKTGGKQYKVQPGDTLTVEKLAADAGEKVQFNEILMLGGDTPVIGAPFVDGAAVQAEIVDQIKGDKVIHFVRRRRKHSSKRTKGHRQQLTLLRVTEILENGADKTGVKAALGAGSVAAPKAAKPAKAEAPKKAAAEKAAPKKAEPKKAEATVSADDLKLITGIGPAAEKKLNEAGVTTYAQLAKLDADTFEAVKVKPEWIEQAKEMAK